MGADAFGIVVVDGSDFEDGLQVAEAAFDVGQAFEQSGRVGGRQVVVGARQQGLAVQPRLCRLDRAVDGQASASADEVSGEDRVGQQLTIGREAGVPRPAC